jgi:UrcA family protein
MMKSFARKTTGSGRFPAALAIAAFSAGVLGVFSGRAHAAEYEGITISSPTVKTVGRDAATGAAVEEMTDVARIKVDPASLTTEAGVAHLNEEVQYTARELCYKLDPLSFDDGDCVRGAIKSAQDQVAAVVAHARANAAESSQGQDRPAI